MKKTVTISQMAKHCQVTSETIRRWIDSGAIPANRTLGGHRRIEYSDFIHFLEKNNFPIQHKGIINNKIRIFLIAAKRNKCKKIVSDLRRLNIPMEIKYAWDTFEAGHKLANYNPELILICTEIIGLNISSMCKFIRKQITTHSVKLMAITDEHKPFRKTVPELDCILKYPKDIAQIQDFL